MAPWKETVEGLRDDRMHHFSNIPLGIPDLKEHKHGFYLKTEQCRDYF